VTRGVKAAEEIYASQMEHYADQDEVREKPESLSLSAEEKQALEKVKEDFLTFERDCLGVTSMERHSFELVVAVQAPFAGISHVVFGS